MYEAERESEGERRIDRERQTNRQTDRLGLKTFTHLINQSGFGTL